ncbi:AraC family transcriptional regulator [Pseudoalteromonas sp. Isolate6]|uniref:AraC family transcriptional regulator n=1 Tax=Pseudoalteromonas sp. Isolate6 TaxID=2908527 RepID=UPI001EFD9923|nr:AraC family transcriptional regulator [Pseudoalteromonas sp. Isolate6]MCG9761890.1 AraC family transcriptional regulator [Pseudoalteromonas sp. Isolate6]
MKTIFEHTQSSVLVLPQALFAIKDVAVVSHHKNSVIFYKSLERDLVNVEFYINTPCLIYIESGREVITNRDNDTIELKAGSAIFLPQGLKLQSDFVKETESLKAYLVFFDDSVVVDYLSKLKKPLDCPNSAPTFCLLEGCNDFSAFFDSIIGDIKSPSYLNIKLQELLHLISWKDNQAIFHSVLSSKRCIPPRRNLIRLLETLDVLHLTVGDLAHLSGRSLSSFNRDFKATYKVTPQKWLREKKLSQAKILLVEKELSVTQVALTMGYENVSAFIKAFKLQYGITPKQIKRCK